MANALVSPSGGKAMGRQVVQTRGMETQFLHLLILTLSGLLVALSLLRRALAKPSGGRGRLLRRAAGTASAGGEAKAHTTRRRRRAAHHDHDRGAAAVQPAGAAGPREERPAEVCLEIEPAAPRDGQDSPSPAAAPALCAAPAAPDAEELERQPEPLTPSTADSEGAWGPEAAVAGGASDSDASCGCAAGAGAGGAVWGCPAHHTYSAALLLAHRELRARAAAGGAPGLELPPQPASSSWSLLHTLPLPEEAPLEEKARNHHKQNLHVPVALAAGRRSQSQTLRPGSVGRRAPTRGDRL